MEVPGAHHSWSMQKGDSAVIFLPLGFQGFFLFFFKEVVSGKNVARWKSQPELGIDATHPGAKAVSGAPSRKG